MSNLPKGGMSEDQMRVFIAESLEELPPDVIRLVYRIACAALSGLE